MSRKTKPKGTNKPKKILGIDTFDYSEEKIKSDIATYHRELIWEDNQFLNRYENIYKHTIKK